MRGVPRLCGAAGAFVLATALSACGHPAATPNALAGVTPTKALARAVAGLGGKSFRMQSTQTMQMDATGMPAAMGAAIPRVDVHQTLSGEVQSAQRFSGVLTSDQHSPVRFVFYDGTAYVSRTGQDDWKETPFLSQLYQQFGLQHIEDLARQVTNVRDAGRVSTGGVDAEKYDATLDPGYVRSLSQQAATSMAASFGVPAAVMSKAMTAMSIDSMTLDFDVARATGRLVSTMSSGQISIDFAKLAAAIGAPARAGMTGVMRIHIDSEQRTTDQGAHIVVAKPTSTGTMTVQEFGALITSGAQG